MVNGFYSYYYLSYLKAPAGWCYVSPGQHSTEHRQEISIFAKAVQVEMFLFSSLADGSMFLAIQNGSSSSSIPPPLSGTFHSGPVPVKMLHFIVPFRASSSSIHSLVPMDRRPELPERSVCGLRKAAAVEWRQMGTG